MYAGILYLYSYSTRFLFFHCMVCVCYVHVNYRRWKGVIRNAQIRAYIPVGDVYTRALRARGFKETRLGLS